MDPVRKLTALCQKTTKRIGVFGEGMEDIYVHGTIDWSQDGPRFREEAVVHAPGGAANAARQLFHWNCLPFLISPWRVRGGAKHFGFDEVDTELCFEIGVGQMPVKRRYLVNDRIIYRADREQGGYGLSEREMKNCRIAALKLLQEKAFDAVLISDYDKGFLDLDTIGAIVFWCNDNCIPVVVDAKKEAKAYKGAILKCNEEYFHRKNFTRDDFPAEFIITHGDKFPSVVGSKTMSNDCPSANSEPKRPVPCLNHVGAGDCFAAHLTLGLAHGLDLWEATIVAHSAGRVYVQRRHGLPPMPMEVLKDHDPVGGKVVPNDLKHLREILRGQRVVFTNGVFRIPSAGHCWLLDWARQQGDVLVVGINNDLSTSRLRPGEYSLPLEDRLAILARMASVDWIVPYSQCDPEEVMTVLRPDVLVKGDEYRDQSVPGSGLASKVLFAPPSPFSKHCTQIVEEIRA